MSHAGSTRFTASTPAGSFTAHYTETGLSRLDFPRSAGISPAAGKRQLRKTRRRDAGAPVNATLKTWHRQTVVALKQILAGRLPVKFPPLDVSSGTDFQRCVWAALKKIKPGQTMSYGEIARSIGRPKAVRAVGGACGANPIPVLIPCHRVLAANGRIGGFSGGLGWKEKLLACEGLNVAE